MATRWHLLVCLLGISVPGAYFASGASGANTQSILLYGLFCGALFTTLSFLVNPEFTYGVFATRKGQLLLFLSFSCFCFAVRRSFQEIPVLLLLYGLAFLIPSGVWLVTKFAASRMYRKL